MRKIALILTLIFATNLMAQSDNTWYTFSVKNGYTKGFKNGKGKVMIPPKFMGFTTAKKFRNIIAVMEENSDNKYESYYLLKSGKKIGRDSLYVWDMAFDCESDGMIRFRDSKTDKVGFFDGQGKVAIPALYAEALSFRNGVVVVYDGEKVCSDGTFYNKNKPCEHWYLSANTTTLLIDKKNKILIKDFKYSNALDLYSMKKNDTTALSYRLTQAGTNNNFYSFNHYKKQFEDWFFNNFIKHLDLASRSEAIQLPQLRLQENAMQNIYVRDYKKASGRLYYLNAKSFIKLNSRYLTETFLALQKDDADYFIGISGLDPMIWDRPSYEKYFDDCGQALETKHPVLSIISNKKEGEKKYQEIFKFLKTDEGFKLISVEIPYTKTK